MGDDSIPDVAGAVQRVSRFLEGWDRLRIGGQHTDLIYSVGAHPDEDDARELLTTDLDLLLAAAQTLVAAQAPTGATPVEDPRVTDQATGLPPLEQVDPGDTILLAAYAASEGVAMSPASGQAIPVRYLSVRGLIRGDADDPRSAEWGQIHVAVPVEHVMDVCASLAKGSTEDLGGD